jgi:hypothetical protein
MSSPPKYTRVAILPPSIDSRERFYFYSGFTSEETIRLARNVIRSCSMYFCWVFFTGLLSMASAWRNGDKDQQFEASWDFMWSTLFAFVLVHLGIKGIKTRNADFVCCTYLQWFLFWMYFIAAQALLAFVIGIVVLAKKPALPHGCDAWKHEQHLVNSTESTVVNDTVIDHKIINGVPVPVFANGTVVNGTVTHMVPNTKDQDCLDDIAVGVSIMVYSLVTFAIVAVATCRARAFIRQVNAEAHADDDELLVVSTPPAYAANAEPLGQKQQPTGF